MPHGDTFRLKDIKYLHDLEPKLKKTSILFITGENCSPAFYILPTEIAHDIEASAGGTHYPLMGVYLYCGHEGHMGVGNEKIKITKFLKEQYAELELLVKDGGEATKVENVVKALDRIEELLMSLNDPIFREIRDDFEEDEEDEEGE